MEMTFSGTATAGLQMIAKTLLFERLPCFHFPNHCLNLR